MPLFYFHEPSPDVDGKSCTSSKRQKTEPKEKVNKEERAKKGRQKKRKRKRKGCKLP